MNGPISFPFAPTSALGDSEKKEPFLIRSNTGSAEYEVQLPGGGRNYEVEIPVALEASGKTNVDKKLSKESSPVSSDKELLSELPDIEIRQGSTAAMLDRSMGVGKTDKSQGPSYTLGLAKVRSFYRSKDYEFALIEINNLLAFYPGSPLLYKMKGSILMKLGHKNLADKSWTRALELTPNDKTLQVALARLKKGMENNLKPNTNDLKPTESPTPAQESNVAH
ncbi:MAG: tetratricopeptide repeat protein [Pseudomonadota bacterium]